MSVFISFHPTEDSMRASAGTQIDLVMRELFADEATKIIDSQEIVFQVKKPLMLSYDAQQSFFRNLDALFTRLSDYSPHFTQVHAAGGAK